MFPSEAEDHKYPMHSDSEEWTCRPKSLAEVISRPRKEWLIDGMIGLGDKHILYGPPKSGKSLVALDLCGAGAKGDSWARKRVARPFNTVYVWGEGSSSLRERALGMIKRRGLDEQEQERIKFVDRILDFTCSKLENSVESWADRFISENRDWLQGGLLIVDTYSLAGLGLSENEVTSATLVFSTAQKVMDKLGCAILFIHHSSKANGDDPRGSSAIVAAVDSAICVSPSKKQKAVYCRTSRHAEPTAPVLFSIENIPLHDHTLSSPVEEDVCPSIVWGEESHMNQSRVAVEICNVLKRNATTAETAMSVKAVSSLIDNAGCAKTIGNHLTRLAKQECSGVRSVMLPAHSKDGTRNRHATHYWIERDVRNTSEPELP